jgi:hypothetical protein
MSTESTPMTQNFSEDHVICKDLWPSQSSNLTPSDFNLWDYFKESVFRNKPRTTDTMKGSTIHEIRWGDNTTVSCITDNMQHQIQMCLAEDGGHFWHMMWCEFVPRETRCLLSILSLYAPNQHYHSLFTCSWPTGKYLGFILWGLLRK